MWVANIPCVQYLFLFKRCITTLTYGMRRNASSVFIFQGSTRRLLNFDKYPIKCYKILYSQDSKSTVKKDVKNKGTEDTKKKKPKEIKAYITLYGIDKSMYVTTIEEASKLAERRNYKIVKVMDFDPKTDRPVYQLMTESQYIKEDKDWDETKPKRDNKYIKGNKLLSLSSCISDHDVLVKVKMMKKWLSKSIEVRVVIAGDKNSGENIYKIIEKEVGSDGKIVQKRIKASDIRFQILPIKKNEEQKNSQE